MLWQTAILRLSKLRVRDEINEALRYYDAEPVRRRPGARSASSSEFRRPGLAASRSTPAPVIAMGSWIGGDRDGNPFVTADVLRLAVGRQAAVALGHHLAALHRALASSCRCRRGS